MTEQLQILATAGQLEHFTAQELALVSGRSLNTVRSVLRRRSELFSTAEPGLDPSSTRGRPPKRYRVTEQQRLQAELGDLRDSLAWVPMPNEPLDIDARLSDRLDLAQRSLRRALTITRSSEDFHRLTDTALGVAEQIVAADAPDALTQRALALKVMAEMVSVPGLAVGERTDALHEVATTIAETATRSSGMAVRLVRALLQLTVSIQQPPPVGIIAHSSSRLADSPIELIRGVATDGSRRTLRGTDEWLWSPAWSAPLVQTGALAGFVLEASDILEGQDISEWLTNLTGWSPRVVIGSVDLGEEAARNGAIFVTTTSARVTETALSGIDSALDQRIAISDTDTDSGMSAILDAWPGMLAGR